LIEEISLNYDLRTKSSMGVCFSKLIPHLKLPVLMNCDCKTARKSTSAHKSLNRAFTLRHLALEFSTNMTNLTILKLTSFKEQPTFVTNRGVVFDQVCRFRLVSHNCF
jgi:hypothetical protein